MSISLQKGERVSLRKETGEGLSNVMVAAGWDPADRSDGQSGKGFLSGIIKKTTKIVSSKIDLDLSAILFSGSSFVDSVYFGKLNSNDSSLRHSGDNLTGHGDGDDEQIMVDLNMVSSNVDRIFFVINSYSGQKFSEVDNVFARVVDLSNNNRKEFVRYDLKRNKDNYTGLVIAKLSRKSEEPWSFEAIGQFHDGRTYNEMVDFTRNL